MQSAADVVAHGALGRMLVGSRIAVVGNYAGSGADAAVIQRAELEIVRHERVRDIFVDCVAFNFIAFTQGFGEKAQILNRFRRAEMAVEAVDAVHIGREFRCGLGRVDLLPVGIGVTPEGSRPLLIEIVQRAEFLPQVPAIGLCAVVAVADDANLICHVPELDVLIVLIVLGQMLDRGFDLAAVIRAVGAVDLAATGCVMQIIDVRHHDLGVFFAHPVGNSRCSCAHNDPDASVCQQIDNFIKFAVIKYAFGWLVHDPAMYVDCHRIDAELLHEADVLLPRCLIPLLRAVIAAEGNAAKLFNNHVYFLLF